MKKTAVDFIVEELDVLHRERKKNLIDAETFFKHKAVLIAEAKEMEKYQIDSVKTEEDEKEIIITIKKDGNVTAKTPSGYHEFVGEKPYDLLVELAEQLRGMYEPKIKPY